MSQANATSRLAHISGDPKWSLPSDYPLTFQEALDRTAERFPEKGIGILDRGGRNADRRNYVELLEGARAAAGRWRALGVRRGDRILLCLPTSWEFIDAWLGAICMGAHPAAIAPVMGGLTSGSNFADRLERYRKVIDASRLLVPGRMAEDLRAQYADTLGTIALSPPEFAELEPESRAFENADPDDLAFLQYTSGSTGTPRAVAIHHRMATHNAYAIDVGMGFRFGCRTSEWTELHSAWLPMHHDMGLIGCLLLAIANGIELSLMNPTTFLARPLRYLETAHGKRTMLSGPNFGYQFCVDRLKPEDLEGLDLSQTIAFTGSEMIRPETMSAFARLTAGAGFTPDRLIPCYGMAEATLAVTFDAKGEGVRAAATPQSSEIVAEATHVASCGSVVPDTEVRISDEADKTLNEGELGEVLVKGPAVFPGYYKNDEETAVSKRGEWLRTGDLGFIQDGELYLAGRFKEILVIRGENVMPHEIEWLAEEARGETQSGERTAAFAVSSETEERIVLVVESSDADPDCLAELDHAIRSRIGRGLSLTVGDLVFARRGRIPRTSSGKLQRGKIKQEYLAGTLETLDFETERISSNVD